MIIATYTLSRADGKFPAECAGQFQSQEDFDRFVRVQEYYGKVVSNIKIEEMKNATSNNESR